MNDIKLVENTLKELLNYMDLSPTVTVEATDDNAFNVTINGDDLSFLIGYRGDSLDGLQTVLGLILFKKLNNWVRVNVDINNYKEAKLSRVEEITKNYVDKVRFLNKEMEMPPMKSFERRHVHIFIEGYDDITSESHGEGFNRRIVLRPKEQE